MELPSTNVFHSIDGSQWYTATCISANGEQTRY